MQQTAFGARDRCYFGAFQCSAPASAADAQGVGRLMERTLGSRLFIVAYNSEIDQIKAGSEETYESNRVHKIWTARPSGTQRSRKTYS
jgi:hypothetical protein